MRLDLGSGGHPEPGWEGVDRVNLGQLWITDLDGPWPWADSSVEELRASHLVEHVADLMAFMDEAWRVLVPGGFFTITHPYGWSDDAIGDPTHRRLLVESSWYYYDAEWRELKGLSHYPITADFIIKSIEFHLRADWDERRRAALETGGFWDDSRLRNGVNMVSEMVVVLEARK